jgi:hypothetical protein
METQVFDPDDPKRKAALLKEAEESLRRYSRERARRLIINVTGYTSLVFVALLLFMVFSGNRFNHILAYFGLSGIWNEETGGFADCSRPENKNLFFCSQKDRQADRIFRTTAGKSAPFALTEK